MPSCGTFERDSVAIEIGNFHPKDHLTQRRLVRRTLHESLVQPGAENQQDDRNAAAQNTKSRMRNTTHHPCHPEATEDHANGSHYNPQNDGVDNGRNHPNPKSSVASTSHRHNCRIRRRYGRVGRRRDNARGWTRGRSTTTTNLSARGILRAALVAEERSVHDPAL